MPTPIALLDQPTKYLFFTGKGGVGKTSVSTAVSIGLADAGKKVLLVSTDAASNLDEMLGIELSNQPVAVPGVPGLQVLNIDPDALLDQIESLLGLNTPDTLRYADRHNAQRRAARLARGQVAEAPERVTLEAILLAGDTQAEAWIRGVLQDQQAAEAYGRLLLAPGARAPVQIAQRSPQICTCLNITEAAIVDGLANCDGDDHTRLAQLQGALKCGTQCGSCLPELRRLVSRTHEAMNAPG